MGVAVSLHFTAFPVIRTGFCTLTPPWCGHEPHRLPSCLLQIKHRNYAAPIPGTSLLQENRCCCVLQIHIRVSDWNSSWRVSWLPFAASDPWFLFWLWPVRVSHPDHIWQLPVCCCSQVLIVLW